MSLKRLTDWLVYIFVRTVICIIQAMPLELCYGFARLLGQFGYAANRRHREVAFDNVRKAFPGRYSESELRRLVLNVYIHFASIISEIAHIPRVLRKTTWRNYIRLRNQSRIVELALGDRPVIVQTAHFGNWEMAGYSFGMFGFKPYSVARSLDNPYLEDLIRMFRTRTGQRIIYKRGAFDQVSAVMRQRAVVAFLSDQDAGVRGVFVDYFGRPASSHKGVALLALEHDAPICVAFARRIGRGLQYEVWIEAVVDPRDFRDAPDPVWAITQECAHHVERAVRLAPDQYLWLHRRWKHRPGEKEVTRKTAKAAA